MKQKEVMNEETLKAMFDENFERLRAEGGHSLSPDVKDAAWQQVRMYWQKLRNIAEKVTDTEVRLNLPNQTTPKARGFCIEVWWTLSARTRRSPCTISRPRSRFRAQQY